MSRPRGRAIVPFLGVALLAIAQGCDPAEDPGVWEEGPPFLIVGQAVEQPASPADWTAIYVQARGGSFVSIVTNGGKHRYTAIGQDAKASCAELPGSEPLYLLIKPDDDECIVETRLYADCDNLDGDLGFGVCGSHASFIASSLLTVSSRLPRDGGRAVDAARDLGASSDSNTGDGADAASEAE
jgi:hypothetical protein